MTRYPLVLVHGLCSLPRRPFGRIPADLRAHGFEVYRTHQDAVGTVEGNAEQLAIELEQFCRRTGAERLNLIAHSKGGIETRWAIAHHGMGARVASLSMLSTPNRGLYTVSRLARTPLFDVLSLPVDLLWRVCGDDRPDFAGATRALTTGAMNVRNASCPDDSRVFYQSWGAVRDRKDPLMTAFGAVFDRHDEQTDGMVSPASAAWGTYRSTLNGVSHQDLCDLCQRDPPGFDIRAFYRSIAAELAQNGF